MEIRIIKLKAESPHGIILGNQGENGATMVEIDFSAWKEKWEDVQITVTVRRPGEEEIYPATIRQEGDRALWVITAAETEICGDDGMIKIIGEDNGNVVTSSVFPFCILQGIQGEEQEEPPVPAQGWVNQVIAAGTHGPRIGDSGNWEIWNRTLGEYEDTGIQAHGQDGVSPTVTAERVTGGVLITITDEQGTTTENVYDGQDGVSPTVTAERVTGGVLITITDAKGTHTAIVYDGQGGGGGGGVESVNGFTGHVNLNAVHVHALPDTTVIPTKTSDLTNDSGFLTAHQSLAAYRTAAEQDVIDAGKQGTIQDLDVIRSGAALGATALQQHQSLAAYRTAADQDAIDAQKANAADVPTKTSDLNNDSGYMTFDDIYPVGAFWWSTVAGSPAAQGISAGTWEQIKDTFLLAAGNTYTAGATGGSADAVVVSHQHYLQYSTDNGSTWQQARMGKDGAATGNNYLGVANKVSTFADYQVQISPQGTNGTGKNMPPYLTAYCWHRVA